MADKFKKVMDEFKTGELKSGSGKKVTSRKQALAIALAMKGKSKKVSCQCKYTFYNIYKLK